MTYFTDFLSQFSKISELLKQANKKIFLRDLETRLADVKFTKETLSKHKDNHDNNNEDEDFIASTVHIIYLNYIYNILA